MIRRAADRRRDAEHRRQPATTSTRAYSYDAAEEPHRDRQRSKSTRLTRSHDTSVAAADASLQRRWPD